MVDGKAPGLRALGVIAVKARATGTEQRSIWREAPSHPWVFTGSAGQQPLAWKPLWKITTGGCAEPAPRTEPGPGLWLLLQGCVWPEDMLAAGCSCFTGSRDMDTLGLMVRGCHLVRFCVIRMFAWSCVSSM